MECTYSFPSMYEKSRRAFNIAMKHDDFKKTFNTAKYSVGKTGVDTWIRFVVDADVFENRVSRRYDRDNGEYYLVVTTYRNGVILQNSKNYRFRFKS